MSLLPAAQQHSNPPHSCLIHSLGTCILALLAQQQSAILTPTLLLQVDPIKGNIAFSSALYGWSFTLESFSKLYCDVYGVAVDHKEFARWAEGRVLHLCSLRLI